MTLRLTYICDNCASSRFADNLSYLPMGWTTEEGAGNRVWHYCAHCSKKPQ